MEGLTLTIRGQRVMLDSDLATLYGVSTGQLNQALKRNLERFPSDFAFQLERQEVANLKSQSVISSSYGGRRTLPWVFTEHGVVMLASVLNSPIAVAASVKIVRVFMLMREQLALHTVLASKLSEIEQRLTGHDAQIADLFEALRGLLTGPEQTRREIGFHVRDADRMKAPVAQIKK
ncbi:MAG: ORF6N domain-containing protein [Proteobacteria bacterium]|nr:ORF6N domain-containing protein [Pseudomonadota bacterium]